MPYRSQASRSNQVAQREDAGDRRHRRVLVGRDLDADALVLRRLSRL